MENFAVIFDMDGVLADTHSSIVAAHAVVLGKQGVKEFDSYLGLTLIEKIPMWEKQFGITLSFEDFRKAGKEEFDKIKHKLKASSELVRFLEELKQFSVPLAVATVSPRPRTERVLEAVGIQNYFDAVITRDDDIAHRKPSPDIYLKAAEKLSIPPTQCVAIEDSPIGARAAKAAGMKVIGFHHARHDKKELAKHCDLIVTSFSELSYAVVKDLLLTPK